MFPSEVTEARQLRSRLGALVEALDPDEMLASDATRLVGELAALGRLADAGSTLLTARVTESGAWQGRGHTSAADWLATLAGTSKADAAERVKTSERVRRLPRTQRRLRQGRLSARQVREVADGATANPAAEEELLDAAEHASLGELREQVQRAKAAADPDPDATHQRIHRERRVRQHRDSEGAFCLNVRGTVDSGAEMMAALRAEQDRIFRAARADGRREPEEAYLYDALHRLVTGQHPTPSAAPGSPSGDDDEDGDRTDPEADRGDAPPPRPARTASKGSDVKVIVRIDHEALLRGHVEGDETCEIAGLGPVPVSVVRDWLDNDAFLATVITRGVDVVNVAHLGRRFTAQQRTALQWINPTCSRLGCNRTLNLEYDHRTDWSATHLTLASDADRFCKADHALKTHAGWALVPGTGKRPMVPPDDPRHPRDHRTPPGAGPPTNDVGPPGSAGLHAFASSDDSVVAGVGRGDVRQQDRSG
jgi:hypothetical protein